MEIIVTDLTRFANERTVCMAGLDRETRRCIRPLPYLTHQLCRRVNILPGTILNGNFARRSVALPHTEDCYWQGRRTCRGRCRSSQFFSILKATESPSIEEGFCTSIESGKKYISLDSPPTISIITISVDPHEFRIIPDLCKPDRIRAVFNDKSGRLFSRLSITDQGFYDHMQKHPQAVEVAKLNHFIHTQKDLILRIGLSRQHEAPDGRVGYWLQVNGIYTFPNYLKNIRTHESVE